MSLAPPRASPLVPGFRLDRYELLCPIAEGGMASVWIARQTGKHGFQKLVAVKTVLPKYASEDRFQRMFVDEARIASRIEHVNVTQILDVGEQSDVTYLVMEYVDGDALSKVHKAAQKKKVEMPHGIVLRVLADVCGGLHAAHELRDPGGEPLGVVHRDVSPQNVLVSSKGVAKLIDFGIAKARDRLAGDTAADTLKGKVHYMAPEQALGRAIDRRADVWAVGAVLYHLLAGRPAYEGENDIQTIFLLTSGRPPLPLPSTVHPAIAAIVRRAMAHAPDKRFGTAAEMQTAIEEAMIEAKVVTSTSAVAAFLGQHVAERAQKRREAIDLGLKAAAEREKYAEIMKSNTEADGSGSHSQVGSRVGTVVASAMADAASPPSALDVPSSPGSASSQATLGSAAVAVRARESRSMTVAIAAAAAGVGLGLAGLLMLVRGSSARSEATAPAASAATITAPGPATPTTPAAPIVTAAPSASTAPPPPPAESATEPAAPTTPEPATAHAPPANEGQSSRSSAAAHPRPASSHTSTPQPHGDPNARINDGF